MTGKKSQSKAFSKQSSDNDSDPLHLISIGVEELLSILAWGYQTVENKAVSPEPWHSVWCQPPAMRLYGLAARIQAASWIHLFHLGKWQYNSINWQNPVSPRGIQPENNLKNTFLLFKWEQNISWWFMCCVSLLHTLGLGVTGHVQTSRVQRQPFYT